MASPSSCYSLPHCCPPFSGHDGSTAGSEKPAFRTTFCFLRRSSPSILRFPPNFVRQLSTKARRNCSNIGVAQIAASSWSNSQPPFENPDSAADDIVEDPVVAAADQTPSNSDIFRSDQSLTVHAGERYGRGIVTDAITTPVVRTSAYCFKNSDELIDFKEGRHASFEYGRYGNPTTKALEVKMSALERAESTLFVSSGMNASVILFRALVPVDGHIVTTTDCYRKTRIFIEEQLPKMGITVNIIDPADMNGLKNVLDKGNVSLFFTESPTNPFLRCVDIELVSKLCHERGTLVCIDGTFASPLNQKALKLGADLVLHSATKFIGGHNDVLGGCISGSDQLVSEIRRYHNVKGGVLPPVLPLTPLTERGYSLNSFRLLLKLSPMNAVSPSILTVYFIFVNNCYFEPPIPPMIGDYMGSVVDVVTATLSPSEKGSGNEHP